MSKKKPKKKAKAPKKSQKRSVSKKTDAVQKVSEANAQRYLDWRGRAS